MNWKRILSIASFCSCLVSLAFFFILLWASSYSQMAKVSLTVVGSVATLGFMVSVFRFFYGMKHDVGYLSIGPNNCVTIEYAALRSVARKCIEAVCDAHIVKISPKVVVRAGRSCINFRIDISDVDQSALQPVAAKIQASVRRGVEAFCETEVRNVTVNYVMKSSQKNETPKKERPFVKKLAGVLPESSEEM